QSSAPRRLFQSRGSAGAVIINALKLRDIASRLECRLEGDGDVEIVRVSGIAHARPGDLTFVANAKYLPQLTRTRASAAILGANGRAAPRAASKAARPPCAILRADDPYSAFARAVALFAHARPPDKGVDPLSAVAADASLGVDVSIGPFVTVGAGATVGA